MTYFNSYRRKFFKAVVIYVTLIIVTILMISPIIWMFLVSIRKNKEVLTIPPRIIPHEVTFESYKIVLSNFSNISSFKNSIIVCLAVTVLSIVLASFVSYGLSRFKFRGKSSFNMFILTTQMLPPIFLLLTYYKILTKLGLYDTYFGLIIAFVSFTLPFCIIMLKNYFDSTPKEIDDAALIDGCSRWKVLIKIIIPLNIPPIIATGTFAFISAWSELLFAICLTQSKDMRLFTVTLANTMGQFVFKWDQMMALSILSCIPLIIVWIFLQRYIIEGMTAGALKY